MNVYTARLVRERAPPSLGELFGEFLPRYRGRIERSLGSGVIVSSEGYVLKVRVTDIPALEATIVALNRIRGVARTRTTVVLSTKWEGRHG